MRRYTQSEIDLLTSCAKTISEPPRKSWREDDVGNHKRNDMKLMSSDGKLRFAVFMRVNKSFQESFSIGLVYLAEDDADNLTLLRCNGPHERRPVKPPSRWEYDYHVHKASEEAIAQGLQPERFAERTGEYASYHEALVHFLKIASIRDADQYFPSLRQLQLPFRSDEADS